MKSELAFIADALLRCTENRRISFIHTQGDDLTPNIPLKSHSRYIKENCVPSSSSLMEDQMSGAQYLSTTAKFQFQSVNGFCYREQIKVIKKFQNIVKDMTDLKQNLSRLTERAFEGKEDIDKDSRSTCFENQHSVKLCACYLFKMNVECAQSMEYLKNIITHFVDLYFKQRTLMCSSRMMKEGTVRPCMARNLIDSLAKTFDGKSDLSESFRFVAEMLIRGDPSYNSYEIEYASLIVQKLLLLISLNDLSLEILVLINEILYNLSETKLTFDSSSDYSESSIDSENSATELENAMHLPVVLLAEGAKWSKGATKPHAENPNASEDHLKANSNIPSLNVNLNQQTAYFKLIDISNSSGSENSLENESDDLVGNGPKIVAHDENNSPLLKAKWLEESSVSNKSNRSNKTKMNKNGDLLGRIWKSVDSILNFKMPSHVQSMDRNDSHQNSKIHESQNSPEMNHESSVTNPFQHLTLPLNHRSFNKNRKDSNHESSNSSRKSSTGNKISKAKPKTHTETMQVKLVNDGKGLGFVLGFSSPNFLDTLPVPIITAVKPKSPAYKVGVLAKADRILAINRKSVVGVPLKDLEKLKRKVSEADSVELTVEFDIYEVELETGTFDVELDKTLKIGLLFEDLQNGCPMVVSGVVKGSAAHRSGQLFPGDKVMFLRCDRREQFDPLACTYSKDESVRITVQRDPREGIVKEGLVLSHPLNTNTFNYSPASRKQTGRGFAVKRTSVRSVEGTDAVLLDQEITLFRDPTSWDFGFLVGEDTHTGRAYITDLRHGGPARSSGVVKKFDRIVEVNGVVIDKTENRSVLSLLTQANDKVDLLIRRLYHEDTCNVPPKPQNVDPPTFTQI